MNKKAVIQESWTSDINPISLCAFDYEAIEKPTKALMHQAARFMYFNKGIGKIKIDGVEYDIRPHTLCAITPWRVTDIIDVRDTLHLSLIVYDYQFLNTVLKFTPGLEEESVSLLNFLLSHPVIYLDKEQSSRIDHIMSSLQGELGVDSAVLSQRNKPITFLYTLVKIIELMVEYRRCFQAREEMGKKSSNGLQNSILSYIYFHSAEHLTLEKVADVFYISESSLSKKLNDLTGTSFTKLLNNIRIEKASDYLIYTGLTLEEIAEILGFTDASHLSRHFVDKIGLTPHKYRKTYGKEGVSYSSSEKNVALEVTDYLYRNFEIEKLHAGNVAEKYDITLSELNRSLLYYTGMNFSTLLNFIRINKASEMLVSSSYSILDISVSVGYSNIKTFNLNFYKFKGMTPTEFRELITLQRMDGGEKHYKNKGKEKGL
mgnify:FL=1